MVATATATAKNFLWNKSSSCSQEKLEKPVGALVWGGGGEAQSKLKAYTMHTPKFFEKGIGSPIIKLFRKARSKGKYKYIQYAINTL